MGLPFIISSCLSKVHSKTFNSCRDALSTRCTFPSNKLMSMCLHTKNEPYRTRSSFWLAEREGFEPPEPLSSTVFKTAAIDHSAISPRRNLLARRNSPREFSLLLLLLLARAHEAFVIFSRGDFFKSAAKLLLFFELCKFFDTFFAYIEIL